MTRAPLPGKLPEWPERPDNWLGIGHYTEKERGDHFDRMTTHWIARAAYWESRARLAVEVLNRISTDLHAIHSDWEDAEAIDSVVSGTDDVLDAICPLPEEDRT